jgi:hypothetical protein
MGRFHSARIEKAIAGLERFIRLTADFPDDGAFHDVTGFIPRMPVKSDDRREP